MCGLCKEVSEKFAHSSQFYVKLLFAILLSYDSMHRCIDASTTFHHLLANIDIIAMTSLVYTVPVVVVNEATTTLELTPAKLARPRHLTCLLIPPPPCSLAPTLAPTLAHQTHHLGVLHASHFP
jgi:hypothetical protein